MRGAVAAAGTFGFELDPAKLSGEERAEVRRMIAEYIRDAELVREGLYYRLSDPAQSPFCAWAFVAEDGGRALISAVLREKHGNMPALYVRPRGLTPGALYRDADSGRVYPADALADAGFPLPPDLAQYDSFVLRLERVGG